MNKKTLNTLLAGAVAITALGVSATSSNAMEAKSKEGQEKCYGIVKAGMNGCGAADKSHSCATMAKTDASGVEWISLPKGTCEKITGGSLTPVIAEKPTEGDVPKVKDMPEVKGEHKEGDAHKMDKNHK